MSGYFTGLFGSSRTSNNDLTGSDGSDLSAAADSGYGHGGHGGGYGHSGHGGGYGHSSGYGGHSSGYGSHSGYGHDKEECCPLVIDALCLFVLLGAIGAAALFLERVINIEIMMGGRRRKRELELVIATGTD